MSTPSLLPNNPVPIEIKFDKALAASLKALLKASELPDAPPTEVSKPWELGIDLAWLKKLKERFESDTDSGWKVDELEARINKYPNCLVRMKASSDADEKEFVDVHFVHVRSAREDAIPLVMQHGWPGTFWDFHKVIEPLTNPPPGRPAFHVILPSLPGFFLSTHPKHREWSPVDDAKLIHRLITEVLGYKKYTGQAGDWGHAVFRIIGHLYPTQVPLIHFNMFMTPPPPGVDDSLFPGVDNSSFTEGEKRAVRRHREFETTGIGYFMIQCTKPFTIGYALQSSPLGLLTYIGEKMYEWSDPSTLDDNDVLDTVALYYLSKSFANSVMIYQEYTKIRDEMIEGKWNVKSKIGFTLFPYEIGAPPRAYIEAVADVAFYNEHSVGGHFPGLDNPKGLVEDVREFIGKHWET